MDLPEVKKFQIGGEEFDIVPYLTFNQMHQIIGGCVEVFDSGIKDLEDNLVKDDIGGWDKNVLFMERNFNSFLVEKCTTLKDWDYDVLIANGIFELLYDEIINARETLDKVYDIIEKRDSVPYILEKSVDKIISKIPTSKELSGLYSKISKDLTSGKFEKVVEKLKDTFDLTSKIQ